MLNDFNVPILRLHTSRVPKNEFRQTVLGLFLRSYDKMKETGQLAFVLDAEPAILSNYERSELFLAEVLYLNNELLDKSLQLKPKAKEGYVVVSTSGVTADKYHETLASLFVHAYDTMALTGQYKFFLYAEPVNPKNLSNSEQFTAQVQFMSAKHLLDLANDIDKDKDKV